MMGSTTFTPVMLQHVNFVVPNGKLPQAKEFYSGVIGFGIDPVPHLQRDTLAWYALFHPLRSFLIASRFRIGDGPQQARSISCQYNLC